MGFIHHTEVPELLDICEAGVGGLLSPVVRKTPGMLQRCSLALFDCAFHWLHTSFSSFFSPEINITLFQFGKSTGAHVGNVAMLNAYTILASHTSYGVHAT